MIDKRIGDIRLVGNSRAGEESVIAAPELNVCFDIGLAPREVLSVDYVCLTHGHADHAAGIHYYFSQRDFIGNAPGCVLAHPRLVEHLGRLMEVWTDIEGHEIPRRIEPIQAGQDFPIRRNLLVRAFTNNHGRASLGFAAIEVKHKLKPEYAELSQAQIVNLKNQGVTIDYRVEAPLVAYCGDTADGPFLDLPYVRDSRVILLECTFFDREHVQRARAGRHLHVVDLPGILSRLNCPHVVLTHTSRRTSIRDAKRILLQVVGKQQAERVEIFMDRPPARGPRPERGSGAARPADERPPAADNLR